MKYQVSGLVTVSCTTVVEAKNEKEALEMAQQRDIASLCHGPYIEDIDECFHIETDGDAKELTVDGPYDDEDDY
jgi:hypothetical protein